MGDYTPMEAIIYACPPAGVGQVLDVLENHNLTLGWGLGSETYDKLELCSTYGVHEATGEESLEVANELAEITGVVAKVWTSPKYEWLGLLCCHAPGLGLFQNDCDDSGTPQFEATFIRSLLHLHREKTVAEFLDRVLPRALGEAWDKEFTRLFELNNGTVLPRPEED